MANQNPNRNGQQHAWFWVDWRWNWFTSFQHYFLLEISHSSPLISISLTTIFGGGVDGEDDGVREGLREVDLGVRQGPLPRRDGLLLTDRFNSRQRS